MQLGTVNRTVQSFAEIFIPTIGVIEKQIDQADIQNVSSC